MLILILSTSEDQDQAIDLRRKEKLMRRLDYRYIDDKELPLSRISFKRFTFERYLQLLKNHDISEMHPMNRQKLIMSLNYFPDKDLISMGVI